MKNAEAEKPQFKSGYVAIVGKPNVGKSTLLNNLLHFKVSSVTRKPQTTRHQIRGILTEDHFQIVFLDTPGLLAPRYKLQEAMLQAALRSVKEADLVLFIVEAATQPDPIDLENLAKIRAENSQLIMAINKVDVVKKDVLLPLIQHYHEQEKIETLVPVSALKADGLDALKEEIVRLLPAGMPFYPRDQIMDHPERFLAAEIIRERIFLRYGDEIPYSTTVEIEDFKEREKGKDFVRATIYVERQSQKGILIGKKGAALREIGAQARREMETLLGRSIYLELWVKVKEKWRDSEIILKKFGYY